MRCRSLDPISLIWWFIRGHQQLPTCSYWSWCFSQSITRLDVYFSTSCAAILCSNQFSYYHSPFLISFGYLFCSPTTGWLRNWSSVFPVVSFTSDLQLYRSRGRNWERPKHLSLGQVSWGKGHSWAALQGCPSLSLVPTRSLIGLYPTPPAFNWAGRGRYTSQGTLGIC
jgi:hypothetical protein